MFMPQRRTEVRLAAATPTLKAGSLSYPTNGLAKANSMAIPTPIRKAASIRPANRNILVCKAFISSGWRAEASMYLPPMMAIPRHAPMAPKPMIRPQARATKATLVMTTPWKRISKLKNKKWNGQNPLALALPGTRKTRRFGTSWLLADQLRVGSAYPATDPPGSLVAHLSVLRAPDRYTQESAS